MATSFSALPIIDLSVLSDPHPPSVELADLGTRLQNVLATTGFAYLVNTPLSSSQDEIIGTAKSFFAQMMSDKMRLAKKTFVPSNKNTYRGYFPSQTGQDDNFKEGFEIGSSTLPRLSQPTRMAKFDLAEGNVWPSETSFPGGRQCLEKLYAELQGLSSTLLSLLATSLGKQSDFFSSHLVDSLSTLRLLHYPPQSSDPDFDSEDMRLCCSPHTDSGILTLLIQDPSGGLEVLNGNGGWVAAPHVPNSLIVNIGDLLAKLSGGRFVATVHRVRSSGQDTPNSVGRFSVPFFFEPGEACVLRSIDGQDVVVYGEHLKRKMNMWAEFQDAPSQSS